MFDSLLDKGESELEKFAENPDDVKKVGSKAEELLGQHMDQQQADELVGKGEQWVDDYEKRSRQSQ